MARVRGGDQRLYRLGGDHAGLAVHIGPHRLAAQHRDRLVARDTGERRGHDLGPGPDTSQLERDRQAHGARIDRDRARVADEARNGLGEGLNPDPFGKKTALQRLRHARLGLGRHEDFKERNQFGGC